MDRRRFLLTSLAGALAAPLAAGAQAGSIAQEAGGTFRIGFVGVYDAGLAAPGLQRYQRRLRELGWVEGQNISTTYGWPMGRSVGSPASCARS